MKSYRFALALVPVISVQAAAADAPREVQYGQVPAWVLPPPAATAGPQTGDAAFRIIYQDTQERVTTDAVEDYSAYEVKILKPEALAMGNVAVAWSPSAGPATVHYVRIIRDGKSIDVLKQTKFKILERETGLEQSILDGNLTATLQVPGLQVGDELQFAATIVRHEPAFGMHAAGAAQLPVGGFPGVFRYRLQWPESKPIKWRLTKDLPAVAPKTDQGFKTLEIELRDPPAIPDVEGAPTRFDVRRAIEYTDYAGWSGLSKQLWPLYEKASTLLPNSPIHAEAARIAAASRDPTQRAQAALRLVQEQIRYVFVGLDGGNYIPATADQTWQRRFGDCKAKTVLLLALLRELGIKADPVLVNSKGGDGMNERMPNPTLFDHVLVRANVGGKDIWLDGTRLGDHFLDMMPPPLFEWGLPLTTAGAELLAVQPATSPYPQAITVEDIDATRGFDKDAVWTVKHVLRGDEAFQIESALSTVAPADADRMLKTYWRQQNNWIEPDQVGWHYDERHAALVLTLKGEGKADWDGSIQEGHSLKIPGAGFYAPEKMHRLKDQDQSAAWAVEYPKFRCWVTTVHLPQPAARFHWTYSAKPVDRRFAGAIYWRSSGLRGNSVQTIMSRQSFTREISAAEAQQVNAALPAFDNNMSTVEETLSPGTGQSATLPFASEPDWASNAALCSPPNSQP